MQVSNFLEISRDPSLHIQSVPGSLSLGLHTREPGSEATCCISYTEMTEKLGTAILREAIMHTVHALAQAGIILYHAVKWAFPRSEP